MIVSFPPFRLDLDEERLWRDDQELGVRRKPFAILRYLALNPRRLVTHEEILAHVWQGTVVSESSVRSHVHELRQVLGEGVIETVVGRGYRFTAETTDAEVATHARPETRTHVVGRDAELAVLSSALERARAGQRQICFVTGEPGIGKTTLVSNFLESEALGGILVAQAQCIEQYGTPEAYYAIIELFGRLLRSPRGERVLAALVKLAPSFVVQIPHLVPDAHLADAERRTHGAVSEARVMRELIEVLEALSLTDPLVLVLDDLQWSDVATLDLLSALAQRRGLARLLVVTTSRESEARTTTHPLSRVMRSLVTRGIVTPIALAPIERAGLRSYVDHRLADRVPEAFVDALERITGSIPLFFVLFLDDLQTRDMLRAPVDEIAAHRPESVHQLIDIQLDRLTSDEQRVLEAASIVGLEFTTTLVAAALEKSGEEIEEVCAELAKRSLFLRARGSEEWPDGSLHSCFRVTHALVQEVCYERPTPGRRARWHKLVAERLETGYGERVVEIAHVLATHFERAQIVPRAVHYYVTAGERMAKRYAHRDAARLFKRGAALIGRLPASSERDASELRMLFGVSQASVLDADAGLHEPIAMFERMIVLAKSLGDIPQLFSALTGLHIRASTLADYARAHQIGAELAELARTHPIPDDLLAFADFARVLNAMWNGSIDVAIASIHRLEHGPSFRDRLVGILAATDQSALMLAHLCTLQWLRGETERAFETANRAIANATTAGDPYSLGAGLVALARLRFWNGDSANTIREAAERVLEIPDANVWHAQAHLLCGVARAYEGPLPADDIEEIVRTFRARTTPFPMGKTALGLAVVEVLVRSNEHARASELVEELLAFARDRDEHILEAELLRRRGQLATDRTARIAAYKEAIDVARRWTSIAIERRVTRELEALDV